MCDGFDTDEGGALVRARCLHLRPVGSGEREGRLKLQGAGRLDDRTGLSGLGVRRQERAALQCRRGHCSADACGGEVFLKPFESVSLCCRLNGSLKGKISCD